MALTIEPKAEPIPGYRLIERLGGGGFGEVWKAQAPGGLLKAIKIVHGDVRTLDEDGSHRAEQELRAIQRVQAIRHPYLLTIERYDIVDGRLVIVTELADCNLYDRFETYRHQGLPGIPREELLCYLREAAEALDLIATQHQLQHLDIKPQNIFLIHGHVKVADFGLVKDLDALRTKDGLGTKVEGGVTPVYAAPETFEGEITPFCDQYSLAIVYQELLTGHRPFTGTTMQQLAMQHLQASPNLSSLPHADRPAVAKALAKKAENRHASCMVFVQTLQAGAAPTVPAPTYSGARVADDPELNRRGVPTNVAESIRKLEHKHVVPFHPDTPPTMMRIRREDVAPAVIDTPASRMAPPAFVGNGVLVPAVIVGIGHSGMVALKRLRQSLCERFGGMTSLPHLKLFYLDTDPESADQAAEGVAGAALDSDELLLARVNRASHYLKPRRNGRSLIEGWFDSQWLYRIPRDPAVNGQRALGRLAFGDYYASITEKLESFIDLATEPDALLRADRNTSLGVRSNRPRVYVVASLGGGTGGGMFLDVAYAARRRLKFLGYDDPEVYGLLMLPTVDRNTPAGIQATANAYAALTEFAHYHHPDTKHLCTFDDRDSALIDEAAPFTRTSLLPSDPNAVADSSSDGPGQAADFLARDLTLPFGRALDEDREAALRQAKPTMDTVVSTFSLAVLAWPRRALLYSASRRLCQAVIARWTSKDVVAMRPTVQKWVTQQWEQQSLGPELLVQQLEQAGQDVIGEDPVPYFNRAAEPFLPKGWFGGALNVQAAHDLLSRYDQLLGRPEEGAARPSVGMLEDALVATADAVVKDWGGKLAHLAVTMIEMPEFRLAGAEEAVTHLRSTLERLLTYHGSKADELGETSKQAYFRLLDLMNGQGGRRGSTEFAELIKSYPLARFDGMINRQVATVCQTLCNDLSDQLGEINFCRQRLDGLLQVFKSDSDAPAVSAHHLLPGDCATPDEAVGRLLAGLSDADANELDKRMQKMLQSQFTALVHVCLSTSNMLGNLEPAMLKLAQQFLEGRLPEANAAELYFDRHPNGGEDNLVRTFEDASPPLGDTVGVMVRELCALTAPSGDAGERLAAMARKCLDADGITITAGHEDIAFYRELPRVPIARLPQYGPHAREAFLQIGERDRFPPHNRTDVDEWLGPTG